MAVYREGYSIVSDIQLKSKLIFPDDCDYGAPVKQGDPLWNSMKQLTDWYGNPETRKVNRYTTGRSVSMEIFLWMNGQYQTKEKLQRKLKIIF